MWSDRRLDLRRNRIVYVDAGILAASIVALHDPAVAEKLDAYRKAQTDRVLAEKLT
jgi:phosphoribosylcarboxyaminoimidazole (NCAIR) mutase